LLEVFLTATNTTNYFLHTTRRKYSLKMPLKPTKQQLSKMEEEIDLALEDIEITTTNYTEYISLIINGGTQVFWTPVICKTCAKPTLLHQGTNMTRCTALNKVLKGFTAEYKNLVKDNVSIKTDMEEIIAKLHLTTPGAQQPKESKFPIWGQGKSWELYKEEIKIFEKGTIKKPITKFQDLIAALKESKRENIAERVVDEFKVKCEDHDILTQITRWMDISYGQTLTEQIDEVWSQLRRFQRDKDEELISYIEKFDKLMRKCDDTKVGLSDRMKATMLRVQQASHAVR